MNTLKRGILSLALLSGFSSNAQNLVMNGDFENLNPYGISHIVNQCYWVSPSNPTAPSVPIGGNFTAAFLSDWSDYHNGSGQGMDFHTDIRGWNGSYLYNNMTHTNCMGSTGINYFPPYDTPNEFGFGQTASNRMLKDANLTNNKSGYLKVEASTAPTMGTNTTRNDFIEGRFSSELDLFKKYRLTFKYSVPCDEDASDNSTQNKIVFNLFDSEWKNLLGSNYSSAYLGYTNPADTYVEINASSFYHDVIPATATTNEIQKAGSHRLPVLEYIIPAGTPPCVWQTVTIEFCIADLMNKPANNTLSINPLYNTIPLGYMNNAHLLDADFYNANQNGWPYTFTQQNTFASYVNAIVDEGSTPLYDFKNIFGFTMKGNQNVYLDDVSVVETGCNLSANFTVEQACSTDVNGNKFVTFKLTPSGPNYNPYMFQVRNPLTGGAFTTINNSLPLTGTHTYTVPYVQGQQFEFKMGTWSPTNNACAWIETRQTLTVDPNNNFFPKNPDFSIGGFQNTALPPSMFAIVANPNLAFLGTPSKWEIQVYYKNGTNSNWITLATNGNSQLFMWFDCEDVNTASVNPIFAYSNVNFVKVRRTNFGTCDLVGKSLTKQYVNCQVKGKAIIPSEATKMDDQEFNELKKLYNLDDNTYPATPYSTTPDFDVFPNPSSDYIHLQFESELNRSITLVNVQGKVVKEINSNETLLTIDIQDLEAGVYMVISKDHDCVITKRIVKK